MENDSIKIVATIRTLNEEKNIAKCCASYSSFCDLVLIADGGSTDMTVEIASSYPKVKVLHYDEVVECKNGIKRNPDYKHLMFLWDHAIAEGADWIISQDCDQRPNKFLKQNARTIMQGTKKDFILVTQVFLWGDNAYFPDLSRNGSNWWQGLWAWRANINLKVIDKMPHFEFTFDGKNFIDLNELPNRCERTQPPNCFMHFGWGSPEEIQVQMNYYKTSGLIPRIRNPLDYGGKLLQLEDWMEE
jgi:hypothetical protein